MSLPGLFGQANIANILSWHYLWDTYGGFGHDGRRIQPALPSLPSAILKNLAVWAGFFALSPPLPRYINVPGLCLAKLILSISCHGIIFGTHMEALDMMGEEFSLPFPPYHQQSWRIWLSGPVFFFALSPTSKIYKCPWIVFGQANIANILSWHYLWDTYGGFGHDGRRIQPALPSLPSAILKNLAVWAGVIALSPTSKIYKCPCLDCLAKLILPISCHGIIFGTHMEALDMMGEGFSLPFPPYHQQSWRIWLSGPVLSHFHPHFQDI